MRNVVSLRRPSPAWFWVILSFPLLSLLLGSWPLAAQDPGKKPPKEEVEETVKPKTKPPLRVEEGGSRADTPRALEKPGASRAREVLAQEADRTQHPVVRELFQSLARAHDVLVYRTGNREAIEPVPEYVGPTARSLSVRAVGSGGRPGRSFSVTKDLMAAIEHYEHIALRRVDEFLKTPLDREPAGSKKALSRLEMLRVAEKALAAVLRFHESAWEIGEREGKGWEVLKKQLREQLRTVQLEQLKTLADATDWEPVFALARHLSEAYSQEAEIQRQIARLLAGHLRRAVDRKEYDAALVRLRLFEKAFPSAREIEEIHKLRSDTADALLEEARQLEQKGRRNQAVSRMQTAASIWPQAAKLTEVRRQLINDYPTLYVGVAELPRELLPGLAYTDSEKQAVELLFESLVKLSYPAGGGLRYEPELAKAEARLAPLGRQFQLTRNAYWSDSKPLTAVDVNHTVALLGLEDWPGHVPEWKALMAGVRIGGDPYHAQLTLRRGYLDPLSLMSFKVLPHWLHPEGVRKFSQEPIGSGPFQLKGREADQVVFVANPHYSARPDKVGLPKIREIRFVKSADPAREFAANQLHLLLDLPTKLYKELRENSPDVKFFPPLPNRRIYFLAVNYRRPALKNENLRRALAYAIDRETILNTCFREGLPKLHRSLNGPYPPETWAYNPKVSTSPDPHNRDLAKNLAQKARGEKLTLKYPTGDAQVAQACQLIRDQVAALDAGIELVLEPRPPHELWADVEVKRAYDLAYYHHDYASEAYWLWPLLDSREAARSGSRNYLGYEDAELDSDFRKAMGHRELAEVQRYTHRIHQRLFDRMPLIPLWQLDTHIAYHPNLQDLPRHIDPLLVFTDVDQWRLEPK
jgi:peptide/nickel transport system substrate-binding protein